MLGVLEPRKTIRGEFARKIIEDVARIRDNRLKKSYISNSKFDSGVDNALGDMISNLDKTQ